MVKRDKKQFYLNGTTKYTCCLLPEDGSKTEHRSVICTIISPNNGKSSRKFPQQSKTFFSFNLQDLILLSGNSLATLC